IEIERNFIQWHLQMKSPPAHGAWIEMAIGTQTAPAQQSPPAQGAWIEIRGRYSGDDYSRVAPCTGGVD
ncbi:MAG: hypothetical protein IKI77_03415, partial [Oscillospiraceae bacterium]|nr:hypothetical protein [Oscillospiraceae bacterium]